jgi:hypothetical protein
MGQNRCSRDHSANAAEKEFLIPNGQALKWLEKGFECRDQELPYIGCYPCFDGLRPDPRFHDLLRRMKLPAPDKK